MTAEVHRLALVAPESFAAAVARKSNYDVVNSDLGKDGREPGPLETSLTHEHQKDWKKC